jgi:hypothetical protein
MDISTYELEWDEYPLQEYLVAWSRFDPIGIFAKTAGKEFVPDMALEDHWLNCQDDYEVRIRDYCWMDLALIEKVLNV